MLKKVAKSKDTFLYRYLHKPLSSTLQTEMNLSVQYHCEAGKSIYLLFTDRDLRHREAKAQIQTIWIPVKSQSLVFPIGLMPLARCPRSYRMSAAKLKTESSFNSSQSKALNCCMTFLRICLYHKELWGNFPLIVLSLFLRNPLLFWKALNMLGKLRNRLQDVLSLCAVNSCHQSE